LLRWWKVLASALAEIGADRERLEQWEAEARDKAHPEVRPMTRLENAYMDLEKKRATAQAHIEELEKEQDADWRKFVHLRDDNERIRVLGEELAEKAARIEALESKLGSAMQALVQAGLREQVAELDRKHIEELERELAKLQPPSTLDRMIDEGHIDDSPNDY